MDKLLKNHPIQKVNNFLNYWENILKQKNKDGTLKNKWASYVKQDQLVNLFNQAFDLGLYIDGETVLIANEYGNVKLSLTYKAYRNLLLLKYPESIIDIQLVKNGDDFSFKKENGKVFYTHSINDPFSKRDTIGGYVVIKNKRGEFLEILPKAELEKIKGKAKTLDIWRQWEDEMFLKSIMKRGCKRYFQDIVSPLETIDNENYDLDNKIEYNKLNEEEMDLISRIEKTETIEELKTIYKENNITKQVLSSLSKRKQELKECV